ncbi:MAG: histidine--tRNA ligase [Acidobacteria bacterium 13_2_20CM_57_17]|nr:MAG: histidine--tRNA ligase [Acidobacteria bacterium 13_2_20CM_57_17]OLB97642.1 MAG: histidine--tRNA ligase [Acidobacteria bacterium 13_2_20CM_2_57_12]OLE15976.1 MAG: histidine--tRNA ligase [Acidobacteria bacterium 13_1_20CM_4_57_11]
MSEGAAKKEEKPRKFQAIRGTRDLLPPETALWNRVEQTAHEVFETFGFGQIRPPIFEQTELFARAVGGETDIVSKEMYTFTNPTSLAAMVREGRTEGMLSDTLLSEAEMISLRPEATASVCRAFIEHNMQQLPQPVKLYYMGPMFRRERPQKGRYRQFYQIGAEVLEVVRREAAEHDWEKEVRKDAAIDAEVIEMLMTFFAKLELAGTTLYINSIGHSGPDCRSVYMGKLYNELLKIKGKLGADSQRRIATNPLRILDSKLESEQSYIEKLPRITDYLCTGCAAHYAALKRQLEMRGVIYRENWRLVRGLDYYMRTTFEITAQGLGSQNAVCGGGRYDGLVELLGGPPTKGIGFAIGEDRLILSLQESGKAPVQQGRDVYIAWMGERAQATAIRAAKDLRKAGFSVELPPVEQKFGKALGHADKLGAKYALILGDNEVSEGLWTLKTLANGSQAKFTEPDLLEHLKKHL